MCIRDSIYSLNSLDISNNKEILVDKFENKVRVILTNPPFCLLYTSDAADERSSVDLGGRRIIKKKTQIQTMSVDTTIHKIKKTQNKSIATHKRTIK